MPRAVRPTRDPRIAESPFLRRALAHADPERAAVSVANHTAQLLHMGDPVAEYWALAEGVVLWDMGSLRQVEISGPDAPDVVQRLVTRDLSAQEVGQAKYAFMADHRGAVICDPVVLRLAPSRYWLSATDADIHLWVGALAGAWGSDVEVRLPDVAPVQIQGPRAAAVMADLFGDDFPDLGYYRLVCRSFDGIGLVIARTGWGGTDGFEVTVLEARRNGNERAERWWDAVLRAGERHGITVAGPSHVPRIEAGMPAPGCELTPDVTPLEVAAGREWMLDLDHPDDFVGRDALLARRDAGPTATLVGVEIDGAPLGSFVDTAVPAVPVLREAGRVVGRLTSRCHSPRLCRNIGLALVEPESAGVGTELDAEMSPGPPRRVRVTALPHRP